MRRDISWKEASLMASKVGIVMTSDMGSSLARFARAHPMTLRMDLGRVCRWISMQTHRNA